MQKIYKITNKKSGESITAESHEMLCYELSMIAGEPIGWHEVTTLEDFIDAATDAETPLPDELAEMARHHKKDTEIFRHGNEKWGIGGYEQLAKKMVTTYKNLATVEVMHGQSK